MNTCCADLAEEEELGMYALSSDSDTGNRHLRRLRVVQETVVVVGSLTALGIALPLTGSLGWDSHKKMRKLV